MSVLIYHTDTIYNFIFEFSSMEYSYLLQMDPLYDCWLRLCQSEYHAEERALFLGFSDAVSQAMHTWTSIVFYPTDQAPKSPLGYINSGVCRCDHI
ncbi:DEKNAAC103889 [Brettanomyces naardenensis]|uniref:DEKNAAC103889 n=1 Tax=Brettanomyces naardenensis TaxID=13370 RepID=A0A448YPP0_BRENA|nr:DEKNAAC103889 [Brettanomyces naardenensis]